MPPFVVPTIYTSQPIISTAVIRKDYIAGLKDRIWKGVLRSKEGFFAIRIGFCAGLDPKVDSELSQEGLNELRNQLGQLGIATRIVESERLDINYLKYPVYLVATISGGGSGAHKTKVSSGISRQR